MKFHLQFLRAGLALALAALAGGAQAQAWPTQSVRIIVPFTAGTGMDTIARAVGPRLSERLGQPVVIVNQNGFYDDLLRFLQRMVDEEFMNPEHLDLWTVVDHPRDAVAAILATPDLSPDVLHRAAVKA